MQKTLIILFTFYFGVLSAAPNLQGIEFFKLKKIFDHYNQHQNSTEDFSSFSEFLFDHYLKNHSTNENEKDLPFKTVHSTTTLIFTQKPNLIAISDLSEFIILTKPVFGEPNKKSSVNISLVWNPPKK